MSEIGLAFSGPFKDPDWSVKFIIGALVVLLCLTGLGIFVLAGYYIQLTQRVMRNERYPLPSWSDLGVKLVVGVKYVVVLILYALPIILLALPLMILFAFAAVDQGSASTAVAASIYMFAFSLVAVPYGVFLSFLAPIIAYRFAAREKIADALNVGAVFKAFKTHWESTVIVALIILGIQSFSWLGILGFIVGVLFTIFYVYLVSAYLHGLLYCEHVKKGGEALV